ncbi:DMT family transporter [Heyndrickxia sporothermodurans]|uniref:DMT family transporter n=1 Tax=Heyndrickxia sporothermodurans TaxID=46224 RepID=UPI0035D58B85
MGELSKTRSVLLITFLVLVWGLCWPIYKIALNYTPPILFSGMRTLLGGILLLLITFPRYKQIHFKENWHTYLISTIFNVILFFGLQTIGLQYLPSGLFSVIVYFQPVLVGFLAWVWLGEKMSGLKISGLVLGFLGVVVISFKSFSAELSIVGVVLALITAISWAIGTVFLKKAGAKVDALWLVTIQCVIGGLVMTGAGLEQESFSAIQWSAPYLSGLFYGAIFGIPLAWLTYFTLVRSGEASKVATYTFLVPLIALVVGTIFLHEPVTIYLIIGLILIVFSIYCVNHTPKVQHVQSIQVGSSSENM